MNRRAILQVTGTVCSIAIAGCNNLVSARYPTRIRILNRDSSTRTTEIVIRRGSHTALREEFTVDAHTERDISTNLESAKGTISIRASYEKPSGLIDSVDLELNSPPKKANAEPVILLEEGEEISIFQDQSQITTQDG